MDQRDIARIAMQASLATAKKGLAVKIGIPTAAVFLAALLLASLLIPAPGAAAASCEDTGPGTGTTEPVTDDTAQAGAAVRSKQITNAKTIDSVASRMGLPGRATLIALMTAMQESTLLNIDYGDRDSLGLFQQRPSQGWGSKTQILDAKFAAESFFAGRGTNKGLSDLDGWQTMPLGGAAQEVQRSAYPDLYAGHETAMRRLAKEADIDLEREGTADAGDTSSSTEPVTSANTGCEAPGDVPAGSAGGEFTDGTDTWALNNPRSVADAIAWAKDQAGSGSSDDWYRRCLAFTANVYGWSYSGVNYAIDHYTVVPEDMRHDGDRNPPPGALMYWDTGQRAGHIAVYLGDGKVASNDILRPGYIDVVDAELFETKWGARYVGWTPPVFPRGG